MPKEQWQLYGGVEDSTGSRKSKTRSRISSQLGAKKELMVCTCLLHLLSSYSTFKCTNSPHFSLTGLSHGVPLSKSSLLPFSAIFALFLLFKLVCLIDEVITRKCIRIPPERHVKCMCVYECVVRCNYKGLGCLAQCCCKIWTQDHITQSLTRPQWFTNSHADML